MSHVSSHSPHGQSPLRTVQVLGGGKRGQQRARAVAGRGAGRPRGAGHRVRPRRGGPRVRVHRAPAPQHVPCPAAATPPRWPRCGRPARTPISCTRTGCTPRCGPRWRSAGGALRSSSPGTTARDGGGRAGPCRCGCWSAGSPGPLPWCSGPRRTWWTGPAGRGARDARLAAVALPAPRLPVEPVEPDRFGTRRGPNSARPDRPLLIAVGSLDRYRGYDTLLDAARAVVPPRSRAAAGDRGGGAAAGRSPAPDRGRGTAGPAHRAARRRHRTAGRRRPRPAAQPLGVALGAGAGGASRARAAGRDRGRRRPRTGRRRGRTRPVRRRGGARRRRRAAARRSGSAGRRCGSRAPGRRPRGRPRTRRSPKC